MLLLIHLVAPPAPAEPEEAAADPPAEEPAATEPVVEDSAVAEAEEAASTEGAAEPAEAAPAAEADDADDAAPAAEGEGDGEDEDEVAPADDAAPAADDATAGDADPADDAAPAAEGDGDGDGDGAPAALMAVTVHAAGEGEGVDAGVISSAADDDVADAGADAGAGADAAGADAADAADATDADADAADADAAPAAPPAADEAAPADGPKIITVLLESLGQTGTGMKSTLRQVTVEIVPPDSRKRWLGGYKNKDTGLEYHNCSTQTYVRLRPDDGKVRFHREVQTKELSSGITNDQMTMVETSTQMTRPGAFISSVEDSVIVPRPYFSAAQWEARRLAAVIVLQSYVRRMRAVRYVHELRKRKAAYEQWQAEEEDRKLEEEQAEWQSRLDRRQNPRTKDDFQLLYHGLEVWRQEELKGIGGLEGEDRQSFQIGLLRQQCVYLSAIDKLKNNADEQNREIRIKKFFDTSAAPMQWIEEEYQKVNTLETPDTLRARELREVYFALKLTGIAVDERLDILLHVKLTVQEYDTKLTREIVDLLNREADLLLRGMREGNQAGLRKRIQNLFLRFCEDPQFNPIAAKYLSVHKTKDDYKEGMLVDKTTGKYADTGAFVFRSPNKAPTVSNPSKKVLNIATERKDVTQHTRIMDAIRRAEVAKGYESQVVFHMSIEDMSYIIDTIWGGASCLSQEDEPFRLTLPRWDESQEWSPWNCVLLTKDEAETHEQLSKLNAPLRETYGAALYRSVTQKHLRAKGYFLSLVEVQLKRPLELETGLEMLPGSSTLQAAIST